MHFRFSLLFHHFFVLKKSIFPNVIGVDFGKECVSLHAKSRMTLIWSLEDQALVIV